MGKGRARIFNILTLVFVVATIAVAIWVVGRMMQPPPAPVQVAEAVPTIQVLPTLTATSTPTNTPLPSFTPSNTPVPPTIAPTRTPTNTPVPFLPTIAPTSSNTPTFTPSHTFTAVPSATLTVAPTITATLTITVTLPASSTPEVQLITQQATPPPPSPFPFSLKDGQVIFTQNFANAAGCAWQGIGGQVFDVSGQPFTNVRVHVFGSGLDTFAQAGSNSLYGPSGWEVPVGINLAGNVYQVELQTLTGTIISQPVTVAFTPNDCSVNLALVNFAASRAF